MLCLKKFKKYYGKYLAIDIPEIMIPSGIHWVKGINGSGKTTFFKCIAAILSSEGEISIGKTVQKKDPVVYRRQVSYIEAEPLYPSFLSGNDLIQFSAKARQADRDQVTELIDTLDISSFINHPVGSYSSGMLKKTALVMGFIGNPKLIILDEPLITIDAHAVSRMIALIKSYRKHFGTSFLISTHQDFEKSDLAIDQIYTIHNATIFSGQ